MKKHLKKKALALSMAMAAVLLLPMTSLAQASRYDNGGLFGTSSAKAERQAGLMSNSLRDLSANQSDNFGIQAFGSTDGTITNQDYGDNAPAGGGMAVLLCAGLGYAALKRKRNRNMKPQALLVMASLLVLGLTQCKDKEALPNPSEDEGNKVSITLKLVGSPKLGITPGDPTATVTFDAGDIIYVGSGGKYIGYLTCQGGDTFIGGIDEDEVGEDAPLQFILLGGQDVHSDLTLGSSNPYTFSLSDQSTAPAVVACATSNENYSPGTTTYTAFLRNKCALVQFAMDKSTDEAITISGVKNELVIHFEGTVETTDNTGDIVTYGTGNTRFAVVPSDQGVLQDGALDSPSYAGFFTIPTAATVNGYIKDATMILPSLKGVFTVNAQGKKVCFSRGNLRASTTTGGGSVFTNWTWTFHEEQWDLIGDAVANNELKWDAPGSILVQEGTVDLFTFSSMKNNHFGIYVKQSSSSFDGDFRDWGTAPITNSGNYEWYVLNKDEFQYLLDNHSHKMFTVNGTKACVLFPDGVSSEDIDLPYNIDATTWAAAEAAGAVLFPFAGYLHSQNHINQVDEVGEYWVAPMYSSDPNSYMWYFHGGTVNTTGGVVRSYYRDFGRSVRLARTVSPGGATGE